MELAFELASLECAVLAHVELTINKLGPVVQNINSLRSSIMVKMLIVLVSTISNSQVFLLKKCE